MTQDDDPILNLDLTNVSGYLIWRVAILWQRQLEQAVNDLDLTPTQFAVLSITHFLTGQDDIDYVTQTLIAESVGFDRMMVSQVARRLESKDYLKRQQHPKDNRAKIILLTASGKDVLRQARQRVLAQGQEFFASADNPDELNRQLKSLYFTQTAQPKTTPTQEPHPRRP